MKSLFYKIYKKFDNISLFATIAYYIYAILIPIITGKNKSCRYRCDKIQYIPQKYDEIKYYKDIKIAFVCDEMTYKSFKDECNSVFLAPSNWLYIMEEFKPDIFFCESAWNGIEKYKDCWRGKIYKNEKNFCNNRKDIFNILDYCKKSGIKTVFWNKEDPIYFNNKKHNFSDTALYFDYIFTTAKECVSAYEKLGHDNVNTLMFGFSEKIFNPVNSSNKKNTAIFAGSWYSDLKERCQDMLKIFKMLEDNNIDLKIYDRNYGTSNYLKTFPKRFNNIIHPSMPFEELTKVYKESAFAVNINTIKNSETMFARRVFELMACNTCVISNDSIGMKKMFGKNVWFLDEKFNLDSVKTICAKNVQYVMENHTNSRRLKNIYDIIGIKYKDDKDRLIVIYDNVELDNDIRHFEKINYSNKEMYVFKDNKYINMKDKDVIYDSEELIKQYKNDYFIIFKSLNDNVLDIKKAMIHFSYLQDDISICSGNNKFEMENSLNYYNCLLKAITLKKVLNNTNQFITKYTI